LVRYKQLLQDNGCAPALGVAIKEERKEAAGSPSKSPAKQKGAKHALTPSPSSKKSPAAQRQPRVDGSVCSAPVRLKLELDAYADAASAEAAAPVGAGHAKKVKRERA